MRVIYTITQYWNSLNRSEKAQIKRFITELGYTVPNELKSHIMECRVARRFDVTNAVLNQVIKHYESSRETRFQ